jgi:hypothetical protein
MPVQCVCRPCLAEHEGRTAEPTKQDIEAEDDWVCPTCVERTRAVSVRSALAAPSQRA